MTVANALLMNARTGSVPTDQASLVLKQTVTNSMVMALAKYEDMNNKPKKQFTYLASGVGAYWVNETEKIQTSKPTWASAEMEAKKLGVIIPASKEFLNYTVPGFFEAMKPEIAEAFSTAFDLAALFGINTPFAAAHSIWADIQASGNKLEMNSTGKGLYSELNSILGMVEDEDGEPNGFTTIKSNKQLFRGVVDAQGRPMFTDANAGTPSTLLGQPVAYAPKKAAWDRTKAEVITGDWDFARYGILQDIQYEVSTDATLSTITGEDGQPINLFERDMFALRATMHVSFMRLKEGNFAALTPDVTP